MKGIVIRSPDDMHFHPRTGKMLQQILPYTSRVFRRGVVMGNLPKSIMTAEDVRHYRREILSVEPNFHPFMTSMLMRQTTPRIIKEAFDQGVRILKYIPDNASTNSEGGVALTELHNYCSVLDTMQKLGMVLSGHWESFLDGDGQLAPEIDREKWAIPFLDGIASLFTKLKIVVEHATTCKMIDYVKNAPKNIGATLTVHHALLTYNDVCDSNGKIYNPHHYCKPIAKRPSDRNAVIKAMISGNPKFFFGSDSAPHSMSAKEKNPPAAGIFTAPVALPSLCELFEENDALPKLEDFVSRFGAEFYGFSLNDGKIMLKKKNWVVPECVNDVRIFRGGNILSWQIWS